MGFFNERKLVIETRKAVFSQPAVSGHCKDDRTIINRQTENEKKANASTKAKEVQPHPQADTRLHHICFCPTAQRPFNIDLLNLLLT